MRGPELKTRTVRRVGMRQARKRAAATPRPVAITQERMAEARATLERLGLA